MAQTQDAAAARTENGLFLHTFSPPSSQFFFSCVSELVERTGKGQCFLFNFCCGPYRDIAVPRGKAAVHQIIVEAALQRIYVQRIPKLWRRYLISKFLGVSSHNQAPNVALFLAFSFRLHIYSYLPGRLLISNHCCCSYYIWVMFPDPQLLSSYQYIIIPLSSYASSAFLSILDFSILCYQCFP